MTRWMDRFIDSIEWIAALFIGIVAADIFISVLLRYFFGIQIPDAYDFGQAMLGILIFWGIAATSYRGTHITVDLHLVERLAEMAARHRRFRDAGAAVRRSGADLHALRQGREHAARQYLRPSICGCRCGRSIMVAWIGDVAAVLLIAVRTYRLIFHPEMMKQQQMSTAE